MVPPVRRFASFGKAKDARIFRRKCKRLGAGGRNRTPDLLITSQLLYLLSYASKLLKYINMPSKPKSILFLTVAGERRKLFEQSAGETGKIYRSFKKIHTGADEITLMFEVSDSYSQKLHEHLATTGEQMTTIQNLLFLSNLLKEIADKLHRESGRFKL